MDLCKRFCFDAVLEPKFVSFVCEFDEWGHLTFSSVSATHPSPLLFQRLQNLARIVLWTATPPKPPLFQRLQNLARIVLKFHFCFSHFCEGQVSECACVHVSWDEVTGYSLCLYFRGTLYRKAWHVRKLQSLSPAGFLSLHEVKPNLTEDHTWGMDPQCITPVVIFLSKATNLGRLSDLPVSVGRCNLPRTVPAHIQQNH